MVFDAHARALAHLGGIPRRPPVHGEFQFCQCWRVMCSLANGWIVGHGHAYDGDLGNRRPPVGNRSPSRRARRGSRRDRRVTPSQASAADPQPIAQKSPETDALGSAAFRCRCLPGVSQTPPKDCDWNQTVNAAALSSGADPAEISTAVHAPSPPETRAERALEGTHRGDLFRCESIVLKSYWVMVVMDHFTRRIVGVGAGAADIDGVAVCRMFNHALSGQPLPKHLSTDNDPLFRFHRWRANVRVLEIDEIKTVPFVPCSHPFVERLIGTIRREYLDHLWFWNRLDLQRKLARFARYYNQVRVHSTLTGKTLAEQRGRAAPRIALLRQFSWQTHCHGLFHTPVAADWQFAMDRLARTPSRARGRRGGDTASPFVPRTHPLRATGPRARSPVS